MENNTENQKVITDKKERIIKAATEIFYLNGYDNTSIRELAQVAELSVAGVYYFFKDKEEILFDILYKSIIDQYETIKSAINEKDEPQKNIRRIIDYLLEHVLQHKMEISILNREKHRLSEWQREAINEISRKAYSLLKQEFSKFKKLGVMKAKNLSLATFTVFAMTTWFIRWYNPDGPLTIKEIAAEMADNLFNGILKE